MTANKIYEHFRRIYEPILSRQPRLATEHAKKQERAILVRTTNQAGYKQMAMTVLMQLKRRPPATHDLDIGIEGEWVDPASVPENAMTTESILPYVLTTEQRDKMGYPPASILEDNKQPPPPPTQSVGSTKTCDRCKRKYVVKDLLNEGDQVVCKYHYGRMRQTMSFGKRPATFASRSCLF